MNVTPEDLKSIARLARLAVTESELLDYTEKISEVLDLIATMKTVDASAVEPLSHPLELHQRQREDVVSESIERDQFQQVAPQVAAGLYLVPKVVE